jgi:hypothetical protein
MASSRTNPDSYIIAEREGRLLFNVLILEMDMVEIGGEDGAVNCWRVSKLPQQRFRRPSLLWTAVSHTH